MNIVKRVIFSILFLIILFNNSVTAQDYVWEIDKAQEREEINKTKHDSILVHLRNNLELSIGFGRFYQTKFYQADITNTTFSFLDNMNQWQFALAWHLTERFVLDLTIESRIVKDVPTPDFFSIISGDDVEIEGKGGGIVPVMLGIKYYLIKGRFRPYIGMSGGLCKVMSQFTEVRGNLNNGLDRTDVKEEENLKLFGFNTGFDYRLGEKVNGGILIQNQYSESFKKMNIGYDRLSSFSISARLSLLIF